MNRAGNQIILILLLSFLTPKIVFSQVENKETNYPKIKNYFSIMHPIATITKDGNHFNFDGSYTVGFPVGINFLQSDKIAYSIEFAPMISFNDRASRVTGLLFHPGVIYRNIGGFNFLTRLAFNTNGRYGFTAVINRPIIKKEKVTYLLATPIPFRFGNDLPFSSNFWFSSRNSILII